jgi:predicted phage terminase large subunit-like protein
VPKPGARRKADAVPVADLLAYLTPEEQAELDALLAEPPAPAPPMTFRAFVERVNPRFVWYRHCEVLADVLQRVADGELRRVMVFMPPRHGKSELVSRLFPAYCLLRHPDRFVGVASYGANLAYTFSRAARDYYAEAGGRMKDDATAVTQWETPQKGGMWAAGVGGPLTGKGFSVGIIDDPYKDAVEANSETNRAKIRDWYDTTFDTRQAPDAAIVVCLTRWRVNDLAGWLLEAEADPKTAQRWHLVVFRAIAEADDYPLPDGCTMEPDWREPGEALNPERYPLTRLEQLRARNEYEFAALYQQWPRLRDGGMFPRSKVEIVSAAPVQAKRVRGWDKAGTSGGGDYTAGVRLSVTADGLIYVEHVVRDQLAANDRRKLMKATADADGRATPIELEQEPGSAGKDSAADDIRLLAGWPVRATPATGDKVTRADPFAAQWQAGNVRLVKGPWNEAYLAELEAFPHGTHDDQVDASSLAYNKLARPTASSVPPSISRVTLR